MTFFETIKKSIGNKEDFLRSISMSIEEGHMTVQNSDMINIISSAAYPLQTDAVEGFLDDSSYSTERLSLVITSTYDDMLLKHVAVCASILFWKTA